MSGGGYIYVSLAFAGWWSRMIVSSSSILVSSRVMRCSVLSIEAMIAAMRGRVPIAILMMRFAFKLVVAIRVCIVPTSP
jgi:hypothetical protein